MFILAKICGAYPANSLGVRLYLDPEEEWKTHASDGA
jgi:hypothetical protein